MSCAILSLSLLAAASPEKKENTLNPALQKYVAARVAEFDTIPGDRIRELDVIAHYVRDCIKDKKPARLMFICTHNSRRSHLSQVWASTAAAYYGVPGVETYSGGTEATAFNPRAVAALRRAGFHIPRPATQDNPHYRVSFHDGAPPMECFSKVYHQPPNPKADFCAVMTCAQADKSCPLVRGAALRIALPYEDPKAFDGTAEEAANYDERCRQIARELLYAFSKVRPIEGEK